MKKAKFISRYQYRRFNETLVEMEYEYRGHRYTVTENLSRGNEPLAWQHRNEQARIDGIIEMEEQDRERRERGERDNGPSVSECLDAFMEYCETGDSTFWDKLERRQK